jgi:predicted ester cyclase
MKTAFFLLALTVSVGAHAQVESTKKGDIEFAGNRIVEMEKYEGSAETRAKFRLLSLASKDTLVLVNFKKDFDKDWMQFHFKKEQKRIEVNSDEIIKGLNYQKNLGSFIVKNNLIDSTGNIDAAAFKMFSEKYSENLTEKYFKMNENNRLVAATRFDFQCDGNKIFVNGKQVGTASLPEGQQVQFSGIVFRDMEGKTIISGDGGMGGSIFKTYDGKEIKLGVLRGNTTSCGDKIGFAVSLLREFFRNGYFRN